MKKILLLLSAIFTSGLAAQASLNVVATLPDFGYARPSFVVALRNADVLIDGGAELELGWLPPLLQNARNPKIEVGKPGRVQASLGVRLMNVPTSATRAAGDVHAMGNPHFMIDPIIAKTVAQHIARALGEVDPPNAAFYQANYT